MPRLAGDFIYLRQQGDGDEALWLLDLLPRMALAAQFCDLSAFKIAVRGASGAAPDVIRDSLRLFGVKREQIVALGSAPTFLQRLVYPLAATGPSLQAIEVLESFPARLPRAVDAPKRLFVAPAPGEPRLTNEAALLDVLAPLGFVRIEPAGLPFKERIAAFSAAEIIVGASRRGLANLVFAPRGLRVLSLSPDRLEALAAATSVKSGRFEVLSGALAPGGFAVDPEAVKAWLGALDA
jgi:capsular polysaccharide biosynthesis protein